MNDSTTTAARSSSGSSPPATRVARSAWHGTRKKSCAASTTTTTLTSPTSSSSGAAPRTREQRADRSREQLDQACEAHHVRLHSLPELSDPRPALRRQAQLGPTRHHHAPLKSEVPVMT